MHSSAESRVATRRANVRASARARTLAKMPAGSGRSPWLSPCALRAYRETTYRQLPGSVRTRGTSPAPTTSHAPRLATPAPAYSFATSDSTAPRRPPGGRARGDRRRSSRASSPGRAVASAWNRASGRSAQRHGRARAWRRFRKARQRTFGRAPCQGGPSVRSRRPREPTRAQQDESVRQRHRVLPGFRPAALPRPCPSRSCCPEARSRTQSRAKAPPPRHRRSRHAWQRPLQSWGLQSR